MSTEPILVKQLNGFRLRSPMQNIAAKVKGILNIVGSSCELSWYENQPITVMAIGKRHDPQWCSCPTFKEWFHRMMIQAERYVVWCRLYPVIKEIELGSHMLNFRKLALSNAQFKKTVSVNAWIIRIADTTKAGYQFRLNHAKRHCFFNVIRNFLATFYQNGSCFGKSDVVFCCFNLYWFVHINNPNMPVK